MGNPILHRVNEGTFIELVLYDDLRAQLLDFLDGPDAETRSTAALIAVVATKCDADLHQLRRAVALLQRDWREPAAWLVQLLQSHPRWPADG